MGEVTRILFTGDSITDAMRTELVRGMGEMFSRMGSAMHPGQLAERTNSILGTGYPTLISAQLNYEQPGRYAVMNRGISGHRIVDLDARVKADCINLQPDVISILVGINDVAHELVMQNGVDAKKFERVYDAMLAEILRALPNVKLILIEPFVLPGAVTEEKWDEFQSETDLRRSITKQLAKKYNALFLPAQQLFSQAAARSRPSDWCGDGVHPTPAGHWLIAQAWLDLFKKDLKATK